MQISSTHCELLLSRGRGCFNSGICEPMMDWTVTKRSYPLSMRRIVSSCTPCVLRLHTYRQRQIQDTKLEYINIYLIIDEASNRSNHIPNRILIYMCRKKIIWLAFYIKNRCYYNSSFFLTSPVLWACSSTRCPALGKAPCIHVSVPGTDREPTGA